MMTTDQPRLEDLVELAFSALADPPAPEDTAALHRRLVAEILLRLPQAEQAAAAERVRSDAWYTHQRVVDATHDALALEGEEPTPDDGPTGAALRVAELARRLRALAVYPASAGGHACPPRPR
ncbi:hypothetical protein C9F11_13285 [Streptomyces sp. YIM 121038]|uniref:DUF6415 family natural product biosynthesis protein n=1 Tax=Streptomyces sp. YIM 121038 TaxID=2136401 RepID=UPI00111059E0|nr:DUF6415 family natural product biosynthesis protein [Streptomyces sp. YIM 121038]QCX76334.1 hypothetical protein C9F11_13285 [Streptomyces sp. YIM 121038]